MLDAEGKGNYYISNNHYALNKYLGIGLYTCNNYFKFRQLKYGAFSDLLNTDKPDERQIMTYVSCYYHAFQGAMQVLI